MPRPYTDTSNANFTIAAGAPVTVTVPDGGQNWTQGSLQTLRWNYTGNPGFVRIELLNGTTVSRVITANTSVGSGGSGSRNWSVPYNQVTGTNYRIRISLLVNPARNDISNATFTISAGAPITVRNPDGGQNWVRGTNRTIVWAYTGNPGTSVRVHLLKGGVLNRVISPNTPIGTGGKGSYAWTVPAGQVPGMDYQIRITSTMNALFNDTSNANFIIS